MFIKVAFSGLLAALVAIAGEFRQDSPAAKDVAIPPDVSSSPEGPTNIKWFWHGGTDCVSACAQNGGTSENLGVSQSWPADWSGRIISLCKGSQGGAMVYGYNLAPKQTSNAASDICITGGDSKQINIKPFACMCRF